MTDRIAAIREALLYCAQDPRTMNPQSQAQFLVAREALAYLDALEKEQGINMRIINAAIGVVNADTYVHPMLSRQDAVKVGVAELYDAVNAYWATQPAATIAGCKQQEVVS